MLTTLSMQDPKPIYHPLSTRHYCCVLELDYTFSPNDFQWIKSHKKAAGNSFISTCQISITNPKHSNGAETKWNVHKYENGGYVKRHVDRQHDPNCIGVELILPPTTLCQYKGGQLVIGDNGDDIILPHEQKWTYIYLPLGIVHEVKPTSGTRISFGRYVNSSDQFNYIPPEGEIMEKMSI